MKPLKLAAALAVTACLCLPLAATATGNSDRLEQQSSAASSRINELSSQLNQNRAGFDRAADQADAAANLESELALQIDSGADRVSEIRDELKVETSSLDKTRNRLRRAERLLAGRLASIYVAGPVDTISVVLGAESFSELSSRAEYLLAIRNADQQLAGRVRSVRDSLRSTVARLDKLMAEAEAEVAALEAARIQIASARAEAEASAARFASLSSSREGEIGELRADIEKWEQQIQGDGAEAVAAQLGGPYSIPTYIVMCESGGNYSALNPSSGAGGAYQIIPSTWEAYGGTGLPHEASKAEQDRIAALIYADSGTAPWVCG
ncbi:MAG: transglycosylase family protein [Solirubrobacterales bacterium]